MAVSPSYQSFVLEQLSPLLSVRAKTMFGAVGLYTGDVFFAIIADDALYFRTDAQTRMDYEAAQMPAFAPYRDPKRVLPYHAVPIHILEDEDQLQVWVERAVAAVTTPRSVRSWSTPPVHRHRMRGKLVGDRGSRRSHGGPGRPMSARGPRRG
jgi:DNA transformation protein and related proteins